MNEEITQKNSFEEQEQPQIIDIEQIDLKKEKRESQKRVSLNDIKSKNLKKSRQSKQFTKLVKNQDEMVSFNIKDPIERFQLRGEGVYFYFYYLKFFTKVFFIIGLISITSIILNIKGGGMKSQSGLQVLLKTTIGNQERVMLKKKEIRQLRNMEPDERDAYIKDKNKNVLKYQLIHMYSDVLINLVFFLSIFILQYKINKKSEEIQQVYQSIKNYTIMVKGIQGKDDQKEEIREYFSKYGDIQQIDFAYKYNNSLHNLVKIQKNYQKILKIENKEVTEEEKQKKSKKKLKEVKKHMQKILQKNQQKFFDFRAFSNFNIGYVFVTFKINKLSQKVYSQFKQAYEIPFIKKITCRQIEPPKEYQFKGQDLQVKLPDHPQNIVWENVEYTKKYRNKRKILLTLVAIGLIFVSFTANLVLTALQEDENEVKCSNQEITLEEAQASVKPYRLRTVRCFCQQYSFASLLTDKSSEEYQLCEKYYFKKIKEFIVNIGIGLLITITNIIIETIIVKFTLMIKFDQITQLIGKQVYYTFLVEYINTAFIIMFIYSEFNGFSIIRFISNAINSDIITIQTFISSFNRRWYVKIGSNLITPLFISIFSPHIFVIAIVFCKRLLYQKYFKNKKLKKSDFEVGSNLKEAMKFIIICYTFSSGIPIYYHFVYAGLFFIFWTQKYLFAYNSKVPPPLGKKFMQSIYPLMKITLVIHMVFSIVFYSNEEIFPTRLNIDIDNESNPDVVENNLDIFFMISRTVPVFIELILFLFIFLIEGIFSKPFYSFQRLLTKKKKLSRIETLELDIESKEMEKNKNNRYHIIANKKYKKIFDFQDKKLDRIQEIIQQSTMQDLVNFDSLKNQLNQNEQIKKVASIEVEHNKSEEEK